MADTSSDQPILMLAQQRLGRFADRVQQRIRRPLIRGQQRFDRPFEFRIAAAGIRKATRTLGQRNVDDLIEERLNPLPSSTGNHGAR